MADELIYEDVQPDALSFENVEAEKLEFLTDIQGQSLYLSWLQLGHEGTKADFLEWLKGRAFEFSDFTPEQLLLLKGNTGKSQYQSYLDTTTDEPPMTESEWANQIGNINAALQTYYASIAESIYSYGFEYSDIISDPSGVRRVGNIALRKSLPIHSKMRGCVVGDNKVVNYYLGATNWAYKEDMVTASNLTGADGQVMVEFPERYIKLYMTDSRNIGVRWSEQALYGYTKLEKMYMGAYEASIDRTNNKLCSVMNNIDQFRGGNNNATWDGTSKDLRGKAASSQSLTAFRTLANTRSQYSCVEPYFMRREIYWLFVCEYANLNTQAAVVGLNPVTGFMSGGLGSGVTTANPTEWNNFNGYNPFVPIGVTNTLGNRTGEVSYVAADFGGTGVNRTFAVPRYRGIENPFGHLYEWVDGILVDIKTDAQGGTSTLFACNDISKFSSTNTTDYTNKGLVPRASGYLRSVKFGTEGDIIAESVVGGGATTFYCDYFYTSVTSSSLRGVYFGGIANDGANAGLATALTNNAPSAATAYLGSRLCFV